MWLAPINPMQNKNKIFANKTKHKIIKQTKITKKQINRLTDRQTQTNKHTNKQINKQTNNKTNTV